jgi:NhaP-type Na+/H+ or K+/H+ antiporter
MASSISNTMGRLIFLAYFIIISGLFIWNNKNSKNSQEEAFNDSISFLNESLKFSWYFP